MAQLLVVLPGLSVRQRTGMALTKRNSPLPVGMSGAVGHMAKPKIFEMPKAGLMCICRRAAYLSRTARERLLLMKSASAGLVCH